MRQTRKTAIERAAIATIIATLATSTCEPILGVRSNGEPPPAEFEFVDWGPGCEDEDADVLREVEAEAPDATGVIAALLGDAAEVEELPAAEFPVDVAVVDADGASTVDVAAAEDTAEDVDGVFLVDDGAAEPLSSFGQRAETPLPSKNIPISELGGAETP
jgi:hypothetical protein